jgi:hypothetical protein
MSQRDIVVPAERLFETSLLIELDASQLGDNNRPLRIGVYSGDVRIETLKTVFVGPRPKANPQP